MYANEYVDGAIKFLGATEGDARHKAIVDTYNSIKPLPQGYKVKYTDSWCACFVSAIAWKVSGGTDKLFPYECSCNRMIELAKQQKIWVESDSTKPYVGWLILYDWDDSGKGDNVGSADHVGIVTKVTAKKITVIEGNKSDSVAYRTIDIDGKYIRGFVAVKFDVAKSVKKKSNDVIAKEVIKGLWGNGDVRKKKLTDAGYDYKAIQKLVNKMFK